MTTFTAPPDQVDLVLGREDILDVHSGGTATGTTIGFGGTVNVHGGTTVDTLINALGVEHVGLGGVADDRSSAAASKMSPAGARPTTQFSTAALLMLVAQAPARLSTTAPSGSMAQATVRSSIDLASSMSMAA